MDRVIRPLKSTYEVFIVIATQKNNYQVVNCHLVIYNKRKKMIDQQTTQKQNQLIIEFEKRTMLSKVSLKLVHQDP